MKALSECFLIEQQSDYLVWGLLIGTFAWLVFVALCLVRIGRLARHESPPSSNPTPGGVGGTGGSPSSPQDEEGIVIEPGESTKKIIGNVTIRGRVGQMYGLAILIAASFGVVATAYSKILEHYETSIDVSAEVHETFGGLASHYAGQKSKLRVVFEGDTANHPVAGEFSGACVTEMLGAVCDHYAADIACPVDTSTRTMTVIPK